MEWQPIETAPKDGSVIQVKRGKSGYAINVYYCEPDYWDAPTGIGTSQLRADGFIADDEWWGFYDLDGHGPFVGITHWMPLPDPTEATP